MKVFIVTTQFTVEASNRREALLVAKDLLELVGTGEHVKVLRAQEL